MSEMADAAVLIFVGIAVPVAGGLEGKAHDGGGQKDGQKRA